MIQVRRRQLLIAAAGLSAAPFRTLAQQKRSAPTIAFLSAGGPSPGGSRALDAFRQRMSELGHTDGRSFVDEVHYSNGDNKRLGQLAADLVQRKVDIILPTSTPATYAARYATATIPIVMTGTFDAQVAGLVKSLAHPGGNITGITSISYELFGKRLQFLREVVPSIARIGYLNRRSPDSSLAQGEREGVNVSFGAEIARGIDAAAHQLGITVQHLSVSGADDLPTAFGKLSKGRAQAVYLLESPPLRVHRGLIAELAAKHRMPTISGSSDYVEAGCLMSYGSDFIDAYRKAADYVDKILKGAKPGDLPVAQPTKFELVVNQKTARTLGLKIPQSVLLRADRVIE